MITRIKIRMSLLRAPVRLTVESSDPKRATDDVIHTKKITGFGSAGTKCYVVSVLSPLLQRKAPKRAVTRINPDRAVMFAGY